MVANPIKLSATPPTYELPPPLLGEHTASVLRNYASVDEQQFNVLKSRGIV
jgi:crotonobetainyl-CoA:carnitine CoA-transferase CaiB-like acyl-CoA transferase